MLLLGSWVYFTDGGMLESELVSFLLRMCMCGRNASLGERNEFFLDGIDILLPSGLLFLYVNTYLDSSKM